MTFGISQRGGTNVLAFGAASAMVVAGLAQMETAGQIRALRFLAYLGDASYSIHLFYGPVTAIAGLVMIKSGLLGNLPSTLILVALVVIGAEYGIVLYELAEKRLHTFFRRRGPQFKQSLV